MSQRKLQFEVNRGFSKLRLWSVVFKLFLFITFVITMYAGLNDNDALLSILTPLLIIEVVGIIFIRTLRFIYRDR
jgi:hypothetical protein